MPVKQLPKFCAVLHTPSDWLTKPGEKFEPNWEEARVREMNEVVHYEVRRGRDGDLHFSLSVPMQGTPGRTYNSFRRTRGGLLAGEPDSDARLLPFASAGLFDNTGLRLRYWDEGSVPSTVARGPEWEVIHSYTGSGLPRPPLAWSSDGIVPWVLARNGFVDFVNHKREVSLSPIEYQFCGLEYWMRLAAAWHGERVFTMPTSVDGRSFIVCEPSI